MLSILRTYSLDYTFKIAIPIHSNIEYNYPHVKLLEFG